MSENIEIKVKLITDDAILPTKAHLSDACFDLHASEDAIVLHGKVVKVPTGIALGMHPGQVAFIYGRSGLATKGVILANAVGVIDAGYRDEVCVLLTNTCVPAVHIKKGDRIAQMFIQEMVPCSLVSVETLDETERKGGFGHTGVV